MNRSANLMQEANGCTGLSQQCPTPSIKVEKVDGGLLIFGVLIGSNCRLALLAFGIIFIFIGFLLTVFAYRGPSDDEDPSEYENRLEVTNNVRILAPLCILVGFVMVVSGCFLQHLSRQAKIKQTRIGFYCPVHGDFYPLSPGISTKDFIFPEKKLTCIQKFTSCFKKRVEDTKLEETPPIPNIPVCPHSIGSNRSSFDGQHVTTSTQSTFTIPSIIVSGYLSTGSEIDSIQNFGSIRSFSIPNDVACFPNPFASRSSSPVTPSSPVVANHAEKRLSCPILPDIGTISPSRIEKSTNEPVLLSTTPEIKVVRPAVSDSVISETLYPLKLPPIAGKSDSNVKKRKSVSIILPDIETSR